MVKSILMLAALAATAVAGDATVYLIRHGEKPSDGGNGLSSQGMERAQCLKNVFGPNSGYNIGYILAQTPKSSGKRERPYQTVEPLAEELGLTVDTSCDRDDEDCVSNAVNSYSGSGNILICWEHKELEKICDALGGSSCPDYPDSHYDLIWTDAAPYSSGVTSESSENCPGLD